MDYIYSQVGFYKTWFLVITTCSMVLVAHFYSFRDAMIGHSFDWKEKPLKSLVSFGVHHQISYTKKVPFMIGAIIVMSIGVCYT